MIIYGDEDQELPFQTLRWTSVYWILTVLILLQFEILVDFGGEANRQACCLEASISFSLLPSEEQQ